MSAGGVGASRMGGGGGAFGGTGFELNMHEQPIAGQFFSDPNEEFKLQQMQNAGAAYGAYRPEVAQARMNGMRNSMSAYQPANNALAQMYGQGASVDPSQMQQNPMGPSMMQQGQPVNPSGDGGGYLSQLAGPQVGALVRSFGWGDPNTEGARYQSPNQTSGQESWI